MIPKLKAVLLALLYGVATCNIKCDRSDHLSPEGHTLGRTGRIVHDQVMHVTPLQFIFLLKPVKLCGTVAHLKGFIS